MVEGINNNVKYIFYIFSCYTDEFYKSMKKDINSIIKNRGIYSSNKTNQILAIENKSVEVMKQKLPKNPDYLFSSDLMISADNMYNMYNIFDVICKFNTKAILSALVNKTSLISEEVLIEGIDFKYFGYYIVNIDNFESALW